MTRTVEWVGTAAVVWFAAVGAGFTIGLFVCAIVDALERRNRPGATREELDVERRIAREREAWERHLAGWVPDWNLSYDQQIEEHGRRWRAYLREAGTLRETPQTPTRRNA